MDIVRITHLPSHRSSYPRSRPTLTARLNAEWASLVTDPAVAAELAGQPIAEHRDLAALLAACGGQPDGHPPVDLETADLVMARIVAAALEGRTLALRVAFQRVLGALVSIAARRTRSHPGQRAALFDELCATAWIVIGSYPLARRPRRVATNIIRDSEYLTCVRPKRLHEVQRRVELPADREPAAGLDGASSSHPLDELAALVHGLRDSVELVEADLALLQALAAGMSIAAIADALGCTDRTIRNRRHRLVRKLRDLSMAG